MRLFPTLSAQFPDGKIKDPEGFRRNEAIKRHGTSVIFLIDQIISEFNNRAIIPILLKKAVANHVTLNGSGFNGQFFMVCDIRTLHISHFVFVVVINARLFLNNFLNRKFIRR